MSDRDSILESLPKGESGLLPQVYNREVVAVNDLWLEFEEKLVGLGGQMVPFEALDLLVNRDGGFWADDDTLPFLGLGRNAQNVWDAEVGVSLADLAISETASLILAAKAGRARLTSLAPPVNVVLIREDAIVATSEQGFARLESVTTVIVTGTSRTADIEGVLVRGVHGPRELYVVRIPGGEE